MKSILLEAGSASPGRIGELDLLRFSAAPMVVLFHYGFRGYEADNLSIMPYVSVGANAYSTPFVFRCLQHGLQKP